MQVNTEVLQKAYVIEDTLRGETFTIFGKFAKFDPRKIFLQKIAKVYFKQNEIQRPI